VCGSGSVVGDALVAHALTVGVTFTGSHDVGMRIYRKLALDDAPRPCITEMGGKNAVIVTAGADLERAALGIVRSAYGMCGQKCSALSRIYVDEEVADDLVARLRAGIEAIRIGDPTRASKLGPVARCLGPRATRITAKGSRATVHASSQAAAGSPRVRCAMVTTARRRSLKRRRRIRSGARRCSCRSRCSRACATSTTRCTSPTTRRSA
jgi:acyl-CoA reductase-like NAD-dependent aldehyde dehydrogenase